MNRNIASFCLDNFC